MDFVIGLPKIGIMNTILVIVDRLMKYNHFFSLKHPFTIREIVLLFVCEIMKLHGYPRLVVIDQDKVFLSLFWTKIFKAKNTILIFNSAYHSQTNKQTKVLNKCLEMYLWCFCFGQPRKWPK